MLFLGASKRKCVAYDRDGVPSGELSGSAQGLVELIYNLRAYRPSSRQDRKKLMQTTLHEQHFSFTQDMYLFFTVRLMRNYLLHWLN